MPELPEVEVTRRAIAPVLLGRRVRALDTTQASYFFLTSPTTLKRRLLGRRFTALERHGKYLLASLDNDTRLLLHLGMTGQLFASTACSPRLLSATARAALAPEAQLVFSPDPHTHLRFAFEDAGPEVYFRDPRKFGKVRWLAAGQSDPRLDKLGPDALTVDPTHLATAARRRSVPVKTLLLDQSVLAGVGNIYADEALFLAGVRPTRRSNRVTQAEHHAIARALRQVLRRSIETGGSSINDYLHPDGSDGGYQDERNVYAREQTPCPRCATSIRRVVVGQRSSHYCPRCQR